MRTWVLRHSKGSACRLQAAAKRSLARLQRLVHLPAIPAAVLIVLPRRSWAVLAAITDRGVRTALEELVPVDRLIRMAIHIRDDTVVPRWPPSTSMPPRRRHGVADLSPHRALAALEDVVVEEAPAGGCADP